MFYSFKNYLFSHKFINSVTTYVVLVFEMQKQIEVKLMNPIREIELETQLNYEKNLRISQLKTLMRIYKVKNKIIYKSIHREYLELIK